MQTKIKDVSFAASFPMLLPMNLPALHQMQNRNMEAMNGKCKLSQKQFIKLW